MNERMPQAFDRVLRRIKGDQLLREQSGNNLNFETIRKFVVEGKPMYGGYVDELDATETQKKELQDQIDEIGDTVRVNGNVIPEESDLYYYYGEDDGIDRSTVVCTPTNSFNIVSGKRSAVPYLSFVTINSKTTLHEMNIVGEFDDELYFLDIEFLSRDSHPYNYTVNRRFDQLTRDDFEISKFLVHEAKKEMPLKH